MTLVVISSDKSVIAIPAELLKELNLREGDEVKIMVDNGALRLKKLDAFLRLRGVMANNKGFDEAIEYLDKAWQAWKPSELG
jgi:antitoxin component of MazEF toxin-antitoxin module